MLHSSLGLSPLVTVLHPCAGNQCEMAQEMCQELHPQAASVIVNTVVFSGAGAFLLFFCGVSDQVVTC